MPPNGLNAATTKRFFSNSPYTTAARRLLTGLAEMSYSNGYSPRGVVDG